MKEYLLGIVCAAFLGAIVTMIGGEGQKIRKLMCGLFLALTILKPLGGLDLPTLDLDTFRTEADLAIQSGTAQAEAARNERITEAFEAYIWNKAASLDLSVQVDVTLGAGGMPEHLTLTGSASPMERQELCSSIIRDLGLGKEALSWIDPYQSSE